MQQPKEFDDLDIRLDPKTLASVENWRLGQDDCPTRHEAVRRLIDAALGTPRIRLSDGERLIAVMVGELMQGLNLPVGMDPAFIRMAILDGHDWAFAWRYPALFPSSRNSTQIVPEVASILDMWSVLEESFEQLAVFERAHVIAEAALPREGLRFRGFEGNLEKDHMSVAAFLIDELGQFGRFQGRTWEDSTTAVLRPYRQMLRIFLPIKRQLDGRSLTAREIVCILGAR